MPIQEKAKILDIRELAENHFKITLLSKYISTNATAGQFVNVRISEETSPLLRRPFSIYNSEPQKELIEILFDVVGEGTKMLSLKEVNEELDILGPLGTGFEIPTDKKMAILVGGGIGIAPLLFLARALKGKIPAVYVIIGARDKKHLIDKKEFDAAKCQVLTCTDDGSAGKKGLAPDFMLPILEESKSIDKETIIYACGPKPMLKACAEIAEQYKIPAQLSMEEKMACGIGACMGCVIKTKSGYQKVCEDGPVFKAEEIIWE
ncbi:MAG: dihydroorotate dehydrogenase electron transfer subunit [Candidatus Margulisbacteria bacterium]|nr:dihydroorotate dehydrogenase electron transfer subunit [Candidatus Margulisiibacteriota bacterium]MBU1021210.1 dihydroorotate dehydrogenase electron transfer subunit [Candidatus Margulisiibacteriota bacterium]MBU1729816.1 dihydroorotate dehydrogenase electron transfer subunit [Candidatus Margulisiibacteriota bacterium]MBU1955317.1 dihydroorotate dehydrogenase electron transfer subunit [Candidatus Margulisiibacteriota bacterium]